jgi:hypothetical protein
MSVLPTFLVSWPDEPFCNAVGIVTGASETVGEMSITPSVAQAGRVWTSPRRRRSRGSRMSRTACSMRIRRDSASLIARFSSAMKTSFSSPVRSSAIISRQSTRPLSSFADISRTRFSSALRGPRKCLKSGEPVGIRTRDLLIKSQLLYRLSYGLLRGEKIARVAKLVNVGHHGFHYCTQYVAAGAPCRLCDYSKSY